MMVGGSRGARVYCGNLSTNIRNRDLEDVFDRYGRIRRYCTLQASPSPHYHSHSLPNPLFPFFLLLQS
jgi:RNA recognition motif-containing protein